jgi:ATP-binding cassette subfamily G (WHITE) protein 2
MKGNHIVIMSIHQPRYSIFKLLDTLTLLSAGNVVYHGQASNALEYFNGAGRYNIFPPSKNGPFSYDVGIL